MSETPLGCRGYIASRPIMGFRVPQHVQNLVIRDHARRHGLAYKLSATEYAMEHCYMMLAQLLDELPQLDGVIAYSMFMLPQRAERRRAVYHRILTSGRRLHAAVEDLTLATDDDVRRWEDVFLVQAAVTAQDGEGFHHG